MDIETLRTYCLHKKGVTESFPFDEETLVFKVMNKMFALFSINSMPLRINLKCDPEYALELRETFDGIITPGYHMNKKHWNTVYMEAGITPQKVQELIDHSYHLIVSGLPKKTRQELAEL